MAELQHFQKRLQYSDITQPPPAAELSKRYPLADLTGIAAAENILYEIMIGRCL
jgi:hypothetical protein